MAQRDRGPRRGAGLWNDSPGVRAAQRREPRQDRGQLQGRRARGGGREEARGQIGEDPDQLISHEARQGDGPALLSPWLAESSHLYSRSPLTGFSPDLTRSSAVLMFSVAGH